MARTASVETPLDAARQALALIIRLHDREPDKALVDGLREISPAAFFSLFLDKEDLQPALEFEEALAALPAPVDEASLDRLAAEYADIYLTHAYRISPNGSVWLTDDHLERQEPMFQVREWYDHYGIKVPNWRIRSDDHIVHELQFVETLLSLGRESATQDAARFLDRHVLVWVPHFCRLMAERSKEPFQKSVGLLTVAFLDVLRDMLEELTGETRWEPEEPLHPYSLPGARPEQKPAEQEAFVPGVAESW